MKTSDRGLTAVDFLRDKQFWRDALRETIDVITQSNGIGVGLTAALIGTGHRLLRLASTQVSPREPGGPVDGLDITLG